MSVLIMAVILILILIRILMIRKRQVDRSQKEAMRRWEMGEHRSRGRKPRPDEFWPDEEKSWPDEFRPDEEKPRPDEDWNIDVTIKKNREEPS